MNKKMMLASGLSLAMMLSMGMSALAEETAAATGVSYSKVIEVEDWGATITKVIVNMGQEVSGEVDTDTFEVKVTRSDERGETPLSESGERRVTNAYISDEAGNPTEAGSYVTLEMAYGPSVSLGSALNYAEGRNIWIDCEYTITQEEAIGDVEGVVATECTGETRVGIDDFNISKGTYGGIEYSIADYKPADGEKHPLIIWLHGGGEGGTDATIPLAANKSVAFASEEVQEQFGGAYVLVPQCPTYWMEGENGTADGTCIYEEGLMEMIQDYVANNEGVDANRIYVGGCSNGGYMTMLLMRDYPDYFAAAYPVCEGLADTLVSDEDINIYKDEAIWFVLAATDTTLDPVVYSLPTYCLAGWHLSLWANNSEWTLICKQIT